MIVLRNDQKDVLNRVRDSFAAGNRAVLLRSPTGSGKTIIAAEVCRGARAKNRSTIFSTPRIQLVRQASNTFADIPSVRVSTKQTIVRRDWPCHLLIDDEAHYGMSDAWVEKLRVHLANGGWVLGLTASPVPGMDRIYQDVVHGPEVGWLMEQGFLSKYRAYGPSSPDLSNVPIVAGDYQKAALVDVMDRPAVHGDAVASWLKFGRGLRTVGYCVSREHSKNTVAQFKMAGIRAEHIDGETPQDERDRIINRFADGETEWLGSISLLTMGFDLASQIGRDCTVECIQNLAPTRSLPRHIQKCGRALRAKPTPAIFIDNAGDFERLGFPDDEFEWSITAGVRRSASGIAVSICHSCFAAFKTGPVCPYCAVERKLTPREVEIKAGELVELERERVAKVKRIEVGMTKDIEGLAAIAKARGFKTGWVVIRAKLKKIPCTYEQAARAMR